jgi:hypothetical protein
MSPAAARHQDKLSVSCRVTDSTTEPFPRDVIALRATAQPNREGPSHNEQADGCITDVKTAVY